MCRRRTQTTEAGLRCNDHSYLPVHGWRRRRPTDRKSFDTHEKGHKVTRSAHPYVHVRVRVEAHMTVQLPLHKTQPTLARDPSIEGQGASGTPVAGSGRVGAGLLSDDRLGWAPSAPTDSVHARCGSATWPSAPARRCVPSSVRGARPARARRALQRRLPALQPRRRGARALDREAAADGLLAHRHQSDRA